MAKYRKKPVVVEAIEYTSHDQYDELKAFVGVDLFVDMKTSSIKDTGIKIQVMDLKCFADSSGVSFPIWDAVKKLENFRYEF